MQVQTLEKKGKGKSSAEAKKKMDAAAKTDKWQTLPHPAYVDLTDLGNLRKAKRAVVEIDDRESELWKSFLTR